MKYLSLIVITLLVLSFSFADSPKKPAHPGNSEPVETYEEEFIGNGDPPEDDGYYDLYRPYIGELFPETTNRKITIVGNLDIKEEGVGIEKRYRVHKSNGMRGEIKIMPDIASQRAQEQLHLTFCSEDNNCQIELKEVGQDHNKLKIAYEIKAEKKAKLFGLFKTKMQVRAQIDAESGEVISSKKPWWAFMATEE